MDFNKKKKRRTRSVQDMYGMSPEPRAPKRSSGNTRANNYSNYTYRGNDSYSSGGMGIWIFGGLLVVAIIVSCVYYFLHSEKEPFTYPTEVVTMTGILTDAYTGGHSYSSSSAGDTGAMAAGDTAGALDATTDPTAAAAQGTENLAIPAGGNSSYPEATSHAELVTQVENAFSLGDSSFLAGKLVCKDESGNLGGYPTEAINAFAAYMSANPDKLTAFITAIGNEATYSAVTDNVYYVALPKCTANIEIGYADTTVSMSTFADTVVDGVTPLQLGPLLPMDYSFTISNAAWPNPVSQTIPVELGKTSIPIKVSAN